jgi:hypothetical protein
MHKLPACLGLVFWLMRSEGGGLYGVRLSFDEFLHLKGSVLPGKRNEISTK